MKIKNGDRVEFFVNRGRYDGPMYSGTIEIEDRIIRVKAGKYTLRISPGNKSGKPGKLFPGEKA